MWDDIKNAPKDGMPVMIWHKDWMDEDFNPTGTIEGFFHEDYGWVGAMWNGCQDTWDRKDFLEPTHFLRKTSPKMKLPFSVFKNGIRREGVYVLISESAEGKTKL